MTVNIKGKNFDTMKEACARLGISRSSMIRYLKEGFLTSSPVIKQGKGKNLRYFPEEWYKDNEYKLK